MARKELNIWEVIRRPIFTEKANEMADVLNQYTFEVSTSANKIQIKDAVELIFNVDVIRVNTMVIPPKRAQRGRKYYIRKTKWKKAVVTVKQGQQIPLFEV